MPTSDTRPTVTQHPAPMPLLRRFLRLFRPYWHLNLLALLAILAIDLCDVASPKILALLIDQAIPARNEELLALLAFLLFSIPALSGIVGIARTYLDVTLSQHVMHHLRIWIYEHLQQVSLRFYSNQQTGDTFSLLTNDVNGVEDIVKNTISQALNNVIKIALVLVLMLSMNVPLTLLCLALVPLFLFLCHSVGRPFRTSSTLRQELLAEVSSLLEQTLTISGALLIKSFGRQRDERTRLTHVSKQLVTVQITQTMRGRWLMLTLHLFFSAIPACVYYLGGRQVIGGTEQVGQLVALSVLQAMLFQAFRLLLDIHISFQIALALFERLFAYLDIPVEVVEKPGALSLTEVQGHIRFRNVSFSYQPDRPVLCDFDVEIQPGQLVALVGKSGSGKTTATCLLPRFYDVEEGAVEIDGNDVRQLTFASLARHIGIVSQEAYLLHTTVRENILYGLPEATEAEMVTAARAACIHERIQELPKGYETLVGPRGYLLSGGEKQRIAIARVLLKNPCILILDEATSSLDAHSERLIQSALTRLQRSRTTIAIAHRLSTVLSADQILVLDKGRIGEQGTHTDLLTLGGLYAHLFREQFEKQTSL